MWQLLCWWTHGQRKLCLGERMGMLSWRAAAMWCSQLGVGLGGAPWPGTCGLPRGHAKASGQPLPPASLGLPADSWLSNVHTRMLPECCQIPASNVLCVLMDKININFNYFFFLFPFYLIFSSPEDFSLLFPPLAGTKITPQQGLDVAGGFVLSCSQAPAHL